MNDNTNIAIHINKPIIIKVLEIMGWLFISMGGGFIIGNFINLFSLEQIQGVTILVDVIIFIGNVIFGILLLSLSKIIELLYYLVNK
ncbi:hypothetical protein [Oribacterium sp. FC2011]|uniref:hypothetical protein n=1 Tax=Oribacterium sp. FC2011 TaxID=1408311 RepID=UPI0004E1C016|nr:hypothetical protein [Oribacterium sp. FC2011]